MPLVRSLFASFAEFVRPQRAPRNADENAILREQQRQLAATPGIAAFVNAMNGTAVFIVLFGAVDTGWIYLWYSAILLSSLLMLRIWWRQRGRKAPSKISGRYLRRAEFAAMVAGSIWGSAAFLVPESTTLLGFFVVVVQLGMASGFAALTAPIPRVSLRYVFACVFFTAAWNLGQGGAVPITTTMLIIVLVSALAMGGYQSRRQLVEVVRMVATADQARQDLVDAIEALNDAFALKNSDGEILLSNKRYNEWFADRGYGRGVVDGEPFQIEGGRWVIRSERPTSKGGAVSIHTDVSALKRRQRELIEARREAEQADEAKTRFLSTMSQELRSPLNMILSFSKLMSKESKIPLGQSDVEEYSEQILKNGQRLLTLIDDIIDYSKIGLDKYLLAREPVMVEAAVKSAAAVAAELADIDDAGDISVNIDEDARCVLVDKTAFDRILTNLISNALKFHRGAPSVSITAASTEDGGVAISVHDRGRGVPEQALEQVFEAFHQIRTSDHRSEGGAGLGLTLSRRLARLHGGDVTLSSRMGVGTTATLALPADARATAPLDQDEAA